MVARLMLLVGVPTLLYLVPFSNSHCHHRPSNRKQHSNLHSSYKCPTSVPCASYPRKASTKGPACSLRLTQETYGAFPQRPVTQSACCTEMKRHRVIRAAPQVGGSVLEMTAQRSGLKGQKGHSGDVA